MACYSVGLDLGQLRDYSALVITERVHRFDREAPDRYNVDDVEARTVVDEHHVRLIRRWSLGTPYTTVVDDVAAMMRAPELEYGLLTIDRTGVGGGVADLFTQYHRDGRMGYHWPRFVTLTAGASSYVDAGGDVRWGANQTAHKTDVIHRLLALSGNGRIRTPSDLPGADALTKELRAFSLKQNARTGNVKYEARRESDHDDLVLALALSVWFKNLEEPRYFNARGELDEK